MEIEARLAFASLDYLDYVHDFLARDHLFNLLTKDFLIGSHDKAGMARIGTGLS